MTSLVRNKDDLKAVLDGGTSVLVPTMGALHEGHRALIAKAREHALELAEGAITPKVVVSVFVNPLQFENPSDFEDYPADLITDTALATEWGADVIWAPSFDDVYGDSKQADPVQGDLVSGELGEIFEGQGRPGHFDGVLKAVAHLFAAVKPKAAVFGEKDFQQLVLVRKLAAQQQPPIEIVAVPTQRDVAGVAFASRLSRLSQSGRELMPVIWQSLDAGAQAAKQGSNVAGVMAAVVGELDSVMEVRPDYVAVVNDELVTPTKPGAARILLAATVEGVRIIDNQPIELTVI